MAARNLEKGEMYALRALSALANDGHEEYMRRLEALSCFKALIELKYKGELNMETGLLHSEDSPT